MNLLAIDPGPVQSGVVVWDMDAKRVNKAVLFENEDLLFVLQANPYSSYVACEMIGHFGTGMPAGKDVFNTCIFIGRCWQVTSSHGGIFKMALRQSIKTHLCGNPRAKDPNVRQALIDRLGPPGKKSQPGKTFGITGHLWSALAVAVYADDTMNFAASPTTGSVKAAE